MCSKKLYEEENEKFSKGQKLVLLILVKIKLVF